MTYEEVKSAEAWCQARGMTPIRYGYTGRYKDKPSGVSSVECLDDKGNIFKVDR